MLINLPPCLAGVHVALLVWTPLPFLDVLNVVCVFYSSTHRRNVLNSVTGQGVQRITEIWWSAKGEAVSVLKKHFLKIWSALEKLTGEKENTAKGAYAGVPLGSLQSFSFLSLLGIWGSVLLELMKRYTHLSPNQRIKHTTMWYKLKAVAKAKDKDKLVSNRVCFTTEILQWSGDSHVSVDPKP